MTRRICAQGDPGAAYVVRLHCIKNIMLSIYCLYYALNSVSGFGYRAVYRYHICTAYQISTGSVTLTNDVTHWLYGNPRGHFTRQWMYVSGTVSGK